MIKQESDPLLHWNYFTAIEADVLRLSRFIELDKRNYTNAFYRNRQIVPFRMLGGRCGSWAVG